MRPLFTLEVRSDLDVALARSQVRRAAALLGFDGVDQMRFGAAVSEVARNAWAHAGRGQLAIGVDAGSLVVRCEDHGPGIRDLAAVLEGRFVHPGTSARASGLATTRRLLPRFEVTSSRKAGTTVVFGKALADPSRAGDEPLAALERSLRAAPPGDAYAEIQLQNRELAEALEALRQERERLLEAQARLALRGRMLDAVHDAVVATDGELRIQYWNRAAEELYGRSLAEVSGRSIEEVLQLRFVSLPREEALEQLAAGRPLRCTASHARPGGTRVLASVSAVRFTDPEVGTTCVAVARDLGEDHTLYLSEASAALGTSLEPSALANAAVELAVPVLGEEACLWLWREEDEGWTPLACAPPERALEMPELWDARQQVRSERHRQLVSTAEGNFLLLPLGVGERFQGVLVIGRRRSSPGFEGRQVVLADQLAERAGAALINALTHQDVRRAVAAREEFLAIASHELRTPLAALELSLGLLGRSVASLGPESELARRTKDLLRLSRRYRVLVDNLLEISQLLAGRVELRRSRFDLVEAAREVVARFEPEAAKAGCALRVVSAEPALGEWDRGRVDQILTNLVSNALKYAPGAPIDVSVERRPDAVALSVRDHGTGVPPEALERIFGRFERAVSKRHFGGLGMGLYISRELAEAHGGTLVAQNAPDGGARFILVLPPVAAAQAALPEAEAGPPSA